MHFTAIILFVLFASLGWSQPGGSRIVWAGQQFVAVGGGQVVFDTFHTNSGVSVSTVSLSITNGSNANRYLLVAVSVGNNIDSNPLRSINSVTMNGSGMTVITNMPGNNDTNYGHVSLYGIINPPTGSNYITVTLSGSLLKSLRVSAMGFSGVNQSAPISAIVATYGNSASAAFTISSAVNDLVACALGTGTSIASVTGTGFTERYRGPSDTGTGVSNVSGGTSTGAASVSATYTVGSDYWALLAVNLKAN